MKFNLAIFNANSIAIQSTNRYKLILSSLFIDSITFIIVERLPVPAEHYTLNV